ncbi:MAG: transcription-repair coupling factor [Spirochaetes bacterium]|nr:transcription-repair coupling factor [Spirochaetota bacterium]
MILKELTCAFAKGNEFQQLAASGAKAFSIEGIHISSFPFIVATAFNTFSQQTIVVTVDYHAMNRFVADIATFVNDDVVFPFPALEVLPYEYVNPSSSIERDRITALYQLLSGKPVIVIATIESLLRVIPHKEFFLKKGIHINKGHEYPFEVVIETLVQYGYERETRVDRYGQFSVKGGIIDIYLPNAANPVRLDFFGDTCESIRYFDPMTQVSLEETNTITIYPRREILLLQSEKEKLQKALEGGDSSLNRLALESLHKANIPGIYDIFPLAIEATTLISFAHNPHIFLCDPTQLKAKLSELERTYHQLYHHKKETTLCVPAQQLLRSDSYQQIEKQGITLHPFTTDSQRVWHLKSIPSFQGRIQDVRNECTKRIEEGWHIIVSTSFEGQARRLYDLFNEFHPSDQFTTYNPKKHFSIVISNLHEGIEIESIKTLIITDHEIFGKSYRKKKHFKQKYSKPIDTFLELSPGDYVVHINHGIGIFKAIERMSAGGVERDFLVIEYAEGDKLYVSLDQINMVQRYVGLDGRQPRIDALGKKSAWNRIKERVQQSVEEIAQDLLKIYSQRKALKGFQYPPDTMWQEEFESKFEYEETPDQITAIEDVKDDMEKPQPMDRLICGDVGFGKTEVAIRAAFKAVMAGKQVAVLVPTTVLAMQHYNTFTKRFVDYPVTIEMLSRFKTHQQMKSIKERLKAGTIDIIIGTHALLAKDVQFKNLGLVVIDEEQRFGVKHKEHLKKLRLLVDVLTLSATPIPRTLHMALAGIRDLSIIATPPENRQSIETLVNEDNPDIVRMAILKEIERKGQVFYVHNRISTIYEQAQYLEKLVPEATFCVAHGRMHEHELEEVMIDFINGKYDVLVSTSIIESGLDMPNVNTIIVNRADTFGLSQLYQLKGRVGRSDRQAYAYLFYPKDAQITEDAQKRLQVIAEYTEIGSGFKIAMKDMEIRGSGNILGKEQSGNIMDVGFDLYCQMLEDAVRKLKGEKPVRIFRTPVYIKTDIFIPDTYINDEKQKIEFYKRYEACETLQELTELTAEMIDRFGPPPKEVQSFIAMEEVRTLASQLYIDEIMEDTKLVKLRITKEAKLDIKKLIALIQKDKRLSIDRYDREIVNFVTGVMPPEKKLEEIKKLLQQLL